MTTTKLAKAKAKKRSRARRPTECVCQVTQRGPNWLFVRLKRDRGANSHELIEQLWQCSQQHFTNRLVVEIDDASSSGVSRSEVAQLGEELRELQERLAASGGALRLCGMRPADAHRILEAAHCAALHNHPTPHDAVTGSHTIDG